MNYQEGDETHQGGKERYSARKKGIMYMPGEKMQSS